MKKVIDIDLIINQSKLENTLWDFYEKMASFKEVLNELIEMKKEKNELYLNPSFWNVEEMKKSLEDDDEIKRLSNWHYVAYLTLENLIPLAKEIKEEN